MIRVQVGFFFVVLFLEMISADSTEQQPSAESLDIISLCGKLVTITRERERESMENK